MAEDSIPVPDPTIRTEERLLREIANARELINVQLAVIEERLSGMDRANLLLNENMTRVPTEVDKQIAHLKGLTEEKFKSVDQRFVERDTRSERESRDNKVAVDAAFAAQKEAASEQNKSNTLAIDKSEKATAETLNKQADLFKSTTDALAAQIADLKERQGRADSLRQGGAEAIDRRRVSVDSSRQGYAILVSVAGVIVAALAIALAFKP